MTTFIPSGGSGTAGDAARRFRSLGDHLERETRKAARRAQGRLRTAVVRRARTVPVIRKMFQAARPKGWKIAAAIVKRGRVVKVGTSYHAPIILSGIAALVQAGGRTAAHRITATGRGGAGFSKDLGALLERGYRLRFKGSRGWSSPRAVSHKGGRVQRDPFAADAIAAATPAVRGEFETAVGAARAAAGLAG